MFSQIFCFFVYIYSLGIISQYKIILLYKIQKEANKIENDTDNEESLMSADGNTILSFKESEQLYLVR